MSKSENPYSYDTALLQHRAWEQGWCAGYDDNEETWCKQVLPIVGEVEESIRYDWENNDTLQIDKIYMIWRVFWQYPPEHDWLEPLVKDVVELYRKDHGDKLGSGELDRLREMADSFGVPLTKKWNVTVSFETIYEVEAADEDDAVLEARDKFTDERLLDLADDAEFSAEEQ